MSYQINGNMVKLVTLVRSKVQVSLNFNYKDNYKDFYMCIKDMKHTEQNFHSVAWVMPQGRDLEVLWVKNLNMGICHGAPSTAHYGYFIIVSCLFFSVYLIRVLNSSR